MSQHLVELMVRPTCGSCKRVKEQITPVIQEAGAQLEVRNVEDSRDPVVVIDGEEFACWEVDNEELAAELR